MLLIADKPCADDLEDLLSTRGNVQPLYLRYLKDIGQEYPADTTICEPLYLIGVVWQSPLELVFQGERCGCFSVQWREIVKLVPVEECG